MNRPKILTATWPYFQKLLQYHGLEFTTTYSDPCIWGGDLLKFSGFDDYNFLADINLCFSSRPNSVLRDCTDTIKFPFLTQSTGTWQIPTQVPDLETCFFNRVKNIEADNSIVNLLWSGGIDSTAMVVAWLKFANKDTKIRVLYSIDSIKENSGLFLHLHNLPHIELAEIGGNVFYKNTFDGVEINGGAGDYLTASVDESFFKEYEWWGLNSPWQDLFWKKNPNQNFMDFCQNWFALSGRDISTVLEARWWFYLNKMIPAAPSQIVTTTHVMSVSFFDYSLFKEYFYYNVNSLFASTSWNSYKQCFKNFIYDYHADDDYRNNKCKENSGGSTIFHMKKLLLNSKEEICTLSDGTSIKTKNMPFLSQYEYRQKYGHQLDYLFTT